MTNQLLACAVVQLPLSNVMFPRLGRSWKTPSSTSAQNTVSCVRDTFQQCRELPAMQQQRAPGPAVVPPMAARAFEKKVATFCSVAVGGRPPTYTRRACRVACCDGAATMPA